MLGFKHYIKREKTEKLLSKPQVSESGPTTWYNEKGQAIKWNFYILMLVGKEVTRDNLPTNA